MAKGKRGRPRKELSKEDKHLLKHLAACGLTQEEIAAVLPVSKSWLAERMASEDEEISGLYAQGRAEWKEQINVRHRDICMGKIAGTPVSEQRKAIEFRLKTEFGYHEKMQHEHSGPNGSPIRITEVVVTKPKEKE